MSAFLSTVLEKPQIRCRKRQNQRVLAQLKSKPKCCYCQCELAKSEVTIEHKIPRIIIAASFDTIKNRDENCAPCCWDCNQKNAKIPAAIADILKARTFKQIQMSSRYLCNLVRK